MIISDTKVIESNHLFSDSKIWTYSDHETERWYTTIYNFVTDSIRCFTKSEYLETTRLTAGISSIITNMASTKKGSRLNPYKNPPIADNRF